MLGPLFAALLMASQPSSAGSFATTDAAIEAWKVCLVTTADKWARLTDEAATVAEGVFGNCSDLERNVYNGMLATRLPDGSVALTVGDADKLIVHMHEVWRPKIIARLLALRAARHRP